MSLVLATAVLPGVWFDTADPTWVRAAILLPVWFALLILLVRPLMVLATLPLNSITLGLPTLLFNGLILFAAAGLEPAFHMDGLDDAFGCLILFTVTNGIATSILGIDEVYPFFHTLLRRVGMRVGRRRPTAGDRGLLILQVDGLSWRSLMRAVRRGRMPATSALLGLNEHHLRIWRCGVPSTTPAVQEALFHGTRAHVPGYRWYDRAADVVRVSSRPEDLREVERAAEAVHDGLLRDGTCINSLLAGGAAKKLLTLSALRDPDRADDAGERADVNLFCLSPWAYTTAVLATVWDFLTAAAWHLISRFDRRKRIIGRSWREAAGRAIANSFLRETAFFWIEQDVARGIPVIYSNFVGYDEVAHYAGPDSGEAFATLTSFDRKLQRLRRRLKRSAVNYDLVLIADHGQSACVPFRMIAGRRLEDLVAELAAADVPPRGLGDSDVAYVSGLLSEMHETVGEPRRRGWLIRRGQRALERMSREEAATDEPEGDRSEMLVCISGGLAHLYRRGALRPLPLEEIRALYPGLVEGLASQKGIACVVARDAQGQVLAVGAGGVRNLNTRTLVGDEDPLGGFEDVALWSRELRRLAKLSDAGDLIVLASRVDERRVISFEEMIGTHGGIGGPQNEPFVLIPQTWDFSPKDLGSPEALHRLLCRQRRECVLEEDGPEAGGGA